MNAIHEQIERCNAEIAKCRAYMADLSNSHGDRCGANLGEVDWMIERAYWESLLLMDVAA